MSYRVLQLSPQSSTRIIRRKISVQDSWRTPSINGLDMGSLRSWFEYDSELGESDADGHTHWGTISGLALSIAFSASFWAGVAWVVLRVWK
jgi:hypothetical protein